MSLINRWECEEWDDWWSFNRDCCRWNQDDIRCTTWWNENPELLEDVGQGSKRI